MKKDRARGGQLKAERAKLAHEVSAVLEPKHQKCPPLIQQATLLFWYNTEMCDLICAHAAAALFGSGAGWPRERDECRLLRLTPVTINLDAAPRWRHLVSPLEPSLFTHSRAQPAEHFYIANAPFCCRRRSHSPSCEARDDAGGTENANYSEQESICPASHSTQPAFFIVTIFTHTFADLLFSADIARDGQWINNQFYSVLKDLKEMVSRLNASQSLNLNSTFVKNLTVENCKWWNNAIVT